MPATSAKQRIAMAIAEHEPDKLYAKNKGMLDMSHDQLHDFASTKGLPKTKNAGLRKGLSKARVDSIEK